MKPIYPKFTPDELATLIDEYFIHIKGKYRKSRVVAKNGPNKTMTITVCDREPEPATITGLALFLGFNSLRDFTSYEQKGKFAKILSRGKLLIEAIYEQKLHDHYTSGPIFALKSMGWNEPKTTVANISGTMNIKVNETGPTPAASEKEVLIEGEMPSIIPNIPMTNDQ